MKNLVLVFLTFAAIPALAQDRVSMFDLDQDGKASYTELVQRCKVSIMLFDRADKNGDGYLSNAEMRVAKGYLFSYCDRKDA